jgi:hypothetical protein
MPSKVVHSFNPSQLGKQRQMISELKASLAYRVPGQPRLQNSVLKQQQQKKNIVNNILWGLERWLSG